MSVFGIFLRPGIFFLFGKSDDLFFVFDFLSSRRIAEEPNKERVIIVFLRVPDGPDEGVLIVTFVGHLNISKRYKMINLLLMFGIW